MKRSAPTLLALLIAGSAMCWPVATAAAGTTPSREPKRPAAQVSTPPPKVDGETTTSGVQLQGVQRKKGRLAVGVPPPTRRPRKAAPANPERPRTKIPAAFTTTKATRLNIGMCGLEQADGTVPGPTRCQPFEPEQPVQPTQIAVTRQRVPRPHDVTWEQVLTQTTVVLFPGLTVEVQPKDRTLVNLDTIVYTDDNGVTANWVTVLGFPVLVEAKPKSYTWNFGDGTTLTTDSPGSPYPSKDITHKYMKRGSANLTVTVTYEARFHVAGLGWQNINGTIPVTGPATPLLIREAVPVLVDPPN